MTMTIATMTILTMTATAHYEADADGNNDVDNGDDVIYLPYHTAIVQRHGQTQTQILHRAQNT